MLLGYYRNTDALDQIMRYKEEEDKFQLDPSDIPNK
jgi:hypothetical protein